ncbi:hypothetical protein QBC39DRAFT_412063 [Podospora conica]|nr:hypothetical protein QBC39DRAFT_412063 [Schizothecium conicum]
MTTPKHNIWLEDRRTTARQPENTTSGWKIDARPQDNPKTQHLAGRSSPPGTMYNNRYYYPCFPSYPQQEDKTSFIPHAEAFDATVHPDLQAQAGIANDDYQAQAGIANDDFEAQLAAVMDWGSSDSEPDAPSVKEPEWADKDIDHERVFIKSLQDHIVLMTENYKQTNGRVSKALLQKLKEIADDHRDVLGQSRGESNEERAGESSEERAGESNEERASLSLAEARGFSKAVQARAAKMWDKFHEKRNASFSKGNLDSLVKLVKERASALGIPE